MAEMHDENETKQMRPAGVVRKVDQLGRIVLPKSLRRRYRMNSGDPVEILVSGDHILLERHKPKCLFCGEMEQVAEYRGKYVCLSCLKELNDMVG